MESEVFTCNKEEWKVEKGHLITKEKSNKYFVLYN